MDIEAERKKFEAWAESVDIDIKKRWDGVYAFSTALYAWMAWQAAVARCEPVDDGKARLVTEGLEDA